MKFDNLPAGTILVGSSSSVCNNCGKDTLVTHAHEGDGPPKTHDWVSGYGPGEPGCGVEFTHITPTYFGMNDVVRDLRPDLEFKPLGTDG